MRVARWHAALAALPGEKFALYLEDSIEFAAALLGAWHAAKTIWLCADTLPSSIAAIDDKVDGFLGEFPAEYRVILKTSSLPKTWPEVALLSQPDDFIGLVVHTSGSTGVAQAIPKKLSQLRSEIATLEHLFGARLANSEVVATVSHQHIYGLLFKVLWPLFSGRIIHARSVIYPEQLAAQLAERGGQSPRSYVVVSSPAHLKRLPDHLNWTPCQTVFCSGGVLPGEVSMACVATLGSVPVEVYGSSETGGIAWRQRRDLSDDAWTPMPDVTWRCESPGEDAADTAVQLIAIRSPHLFHGGWHTLADRVEPVDEGRFILLGRTDRIVKIEEKRISLDAIEQQLMRSVLLIEAKLVVGQQHSPSADGNTERQYLGAVAVLSEAGREYLEQRGKLALNREFKRFLKGVVEPIAVPRRWRYVGSLPVNTQGKTTQSLLRSLFDQPNSFVTEPNSTLLHRDADHAELDVHWPGQLHYFSGHFPDAPVLPGVAQLHCAIKIARDLFVMPLAFNGMHGLKFQHVVLPEDITRLKLHYDAQKQSLSFTFTSAARQYSSGRILFHD